ncbi:hypothetical protein XENOCAPTIV_026908 [Xenoophorus captivus]|uniref:Uncharacterized protein n=1 Tax=Xenoophorus captivus TaxID=1517983 RepID=A0ABV0RKY8_9TELE
MLATRLRELVSSGQGFVRAQFGVELDLKPELYPSWLVLSTAAVGLLLLLGASWAAVYGGAGGGRLVRRKLASQVNQSGDEAGKASFNNKGVKAEEQKKRNKKKTGDKVHEVQAPEQLKKTKKKPKTDVKPVQLLSTSDGKEPDDGSSRIIIPCCFMSVCLQGVWETKVSNREKRQQRRKDKGSDDSASPNGVKASKPHVETPAALANKKKQGNNGNHLRKMKFILLVCYNKRISDNIDIGVFI